MSVFICDKDTLAVFDKFLPGFYVIVQIYETEDITGISKCECFLKRRAFLMHEGFVIPIKSDVEYLN